jgi:hypothetical protein
VATVQASGTTFTINAVSGGSAVVSIKDSVGGETTVIVSTAASGVALFSNAPAGVTVAVGGTTQSYLISGGSPAYSVTSSDAAVASVGVNGSQFVVTGVAGGTATVTIKDSAGASTTVAVTVGSATKLFTTAASSVTLLSGSSQTYAISGGAAPYTASSSNGGLTSASVNGSVLTINGIASGSANVVVLDGAGSSVQIAVVVSSSGTSTGVGAALFTSASASIVIAPATKPTYSIGGGTGPYTVSSSNTTVVSASVVGSTTLVVTGVGAGSATVVVSDALGAKVTVNVVVGTAQVVALYTTAPTSATLVSGSSQTYAIGGGVAPYSVTTSNPALATVSVTGSTFTVSAAAGGNAQISVFDSTGSSVSFALAVPAGGALYTTAPAAVTVATGGTNPYVVGGGAAPYLATSSNVSVATASLAGTALTIIGVSAGTAQVALRDAAGAVVNISVTVSASPALYTTAPSTVTFALGSVQQYVIAGGASPYSAVSNNIGVATVSVTGNAMAITAVSAGTAQLAVRDGVSAVVNIVVTVSATPALYTTVPNPVTVSIGAAQQYTIGGGAGPYTAVSSNVGVASASVAGTAMTITGVSSGTSQVLVRDAAGTVVTAAITVSSTPALFTTAPATVAVAIGSALSYTIGGGTAPYVATSSNVSFATVSVSGATLTLSGIAAGSVQLVVRDAAGAQLTISANVAAANPLSTSAPVTITIAPASAATYQISGGLGPYFVSSTNSTVANGAVSTSTVTITAVASGSASVIVRDSAGNSVSIAVTVSAVPPLYTSAQPSVTIAKDELATYFIGGGTAGYSATISNASVATVSVSGSSITITGKLSGTANVLVLDAVGNTVTIAVTVGSSIALYSSAPALITILPSGSQPYTIGGGSAPYVVASSNAGFVTADVSGSTLTVTGVAAGSASLVVTDALGASLTIAVTVTPAASIPLAVTPLSVTASVGDVLTFTIIGGNTPYAITVNNSTVAQASVSSVGASGGTFTTTLLNAGATTVAVIDSKGQTQTIALTVTQIQPLLRLSPSSVAISELDGQAVVMNIFGGVAPYTVYTSDTNLSSVTLTGTAVTIGLGANVNRCITSSTFGYLPPSSNSKIFGDWTVNFGTVGIIITVVDSTGRSSNGALIIVDNGATCP